MRRQKILWALEVVGYFALIWGVALLAHWVVS